MFLKKILADLVFFDWVSYTVTYPEIFLENQFQQVGGWGQQAVMAPYGSKAQKALVGTRWQTSSKFQGFTTPKLLLIKIYPPQPVMKLIQGIFSNNLA